MAGARKALVVATYDYRDTGLRRLAAPQHDAESFAAVLEDPDVAGFDVTMLVNEPHHVVGEAIADFYAGCRRDDLALLYFSGHGLKDDEGRLHLAMSNTRREALLFTAISAAQLNDAMDASASRRKVLILDCCYSGAFPAGRAAKSDEGVQTLERFQGKGRAVLTASDATQYAFEGDSLTGAGSSSVFTRYLVEAIRSGAADLDEDGDIALDELYSYVRERVVADMPQQRPKKQEDVDGRILIARNVHWSLPAHLRHAIESPIAAQRLSAVDGLGHLHRVGNERVRAMVAERIAELADDDSRTVSAAATALMGRLGPAAPPPTASPIPPPRTSVSTAPAPVSTVAAPTAAAPTPAASTPAAPTPAAAASEPVAPRADEPSRPALPRPSLRAPRLTEEPPPEAATGAAGVPATYPVALVLSLVVIAGVLQLLSRFVVFEGTSGYHAADYGVATSPWLLAVGFPLLLASQILIVRAGEVWALALSAGLVAGAALSQVDLILATGSYFLREDTADVPGPGWWAAAIATVALVVCVVVVLRGAGFGERPRLRRDWRAIVATAVVMVALGAKLDAFSAAWPWFSQNAPALLLAAACLPLTLLALNGRQRWLGLTAVSVFGPWVCAAHVYAIVNQSFPVDQPAAVLAIVSAAVSVAACYLAQLRYRRASDRPATEPVGRR